MDENQNTPPQPPIDQFNWEEFKARAFETFTFLKHFLKNPIEGIKRVPNWDWSTIIVFEILVGGATGIMNGIVSKSLLRLFGSIVISPIYGVVLGLAVAGLIYYAVMFLIQTQLEYKRVFIVVCIALVPGQILNILSPVFEPIGLISLGISCLMLIVGLAENFMLEKKRIAKIVITIAAVVALFWIFSFLQSSPLKKHVSKEDFTRESLSQLQKELSEGK